MALRRSVALAAPAVLGVLVLVSGCGTSNGPPVRPAQVSVDSPSDSTRVLSASVTVQGSVSPPNAAVLVGGRPATVSGGTYSAQVALRPGSNVVDVLAGSPPQSAAMTAVRIFRQVAVSLPDLSGLSPADATGQLTGLGLKADVHEDAGLLESFLPGDPAVCSTSPSPGQSVQPGATVAVTVSKTC